MQKGEQHYLINAGINERLATNAEIELQARYDKENQLTKDYNWMIHNLIGSLNTGRTASILVINDMFKGLEVSEEFKEAWAVAVREGVENE